MELPSEPSEQITFKTRLKNEEHMIIVLDKSTDEEHLSQLLQTKDKPFVFVVTLLTCYNGIFIVTTKTKKQVLFRNIGYQ